MADALCQTNLPAGKSEAFDTELKRAERRLASLQLAPLCGRSLTSHPLFLPPDCAVQPYFDYAQYYFCDITNFVFAPDEWHHAVAVYDGSAMTLYLNGALQNTVPYGTGGQQVLESLEMGAHRYWYGAGISDQYSGLMDDVRIYNRALPPSEVQQLYAYESTPPAPLCTPHAATATATVVNNFVVGATIIDEGCDYTNTPIVLVQGGGGAGATAVAVVSNGFVVSITMGSAGGGYTSTPTLFIAPPLGLAPQITQQPQSLTVTNGNPAGFSVMASGATPFNYQWLKNGANLTDGGNVSGAASSALSLSGATVSDTGNYVVIIANAYGVATSTVATLTVLGPPIIAAQPQNQTVFAGSNVVLSVEATGLLPLSYQWAFNGATIAGATGNSLLLTNAQFEQSGKYSVGITNSLGLAVSSNATLTVLSPPNILLQPANAVGYWGEGVTLQVEAEGTAPLSYQWYLDDFPISWGTNAVLSFSDLELTDAGEYSVEITNLYGDIMRPRQQNLWLESGSGSFPKL